LEEEAIARRLVKERLVVVSSSSVGFGVGLTCGYYINIY
jgi:hypothetical protein